MHSGYLDGVALKCHAALQGGLIAILNTATQDSKERASQSEVGYQDVRFTDRRSDALHCNCMAQYMRFSFFASQKTS